MAEVYDEQCWKTGFRLGSSSAKDPGQSQNVLAEQRYLYRRTRQNASAAHSTPYRAPTTAYVYLCLMSTRRSPPSLDTRVLVCRVSASAPES